jgi:glycosyltransferase involved in cell wall biosynthesis
MFRRSARAPAPRVLNKIVFVGYGPFDCNSGGHIAGFARELAGLGYAVGVAGRGDIGGAYAFGPPAFEMFTVDDLRLDPVGAMSFDGQLDPDRTMLVCWTPRKAPRRAVAKALRGRRVRYVVHFEDNEDLLTDLRGVTGELGPDEDAKERAELLEGAAGATVIQTRLEELLPPGLPRILLEPGVDFELFSSPLPPHRRASLLRAAGAPADAKVLVYPGNVHRANHGEMLELYRAVARLNASGRRLALIRTGKDDMDMGEALGADPAKVGIYPMGFVERPLLVELLKCADLFVQPGAPGPYNDYRLPSKIPEFMAVGRPLVLPATNVGLRLRDRADALLLHTGSAEEIAARVGEALDDPALAARLAGNAQAFARQTWRWDVQGRRLADFLEELARPAA